MEYLRCYVIILFFLLNACNSTSANEDPKSQLEDTLPNKSWYTKSSSNADNYIKWKFGELNSDGKFSWHNFPCGSKPNRSNVMTYNILDGPKLMTEYTTEQREHIDPQVITSVSDIEFVSKDKIILSKQKKDEPDSYTTLKSRCSAL